jgi:ParB family chromosome partitioning protein
MAQKRLGRGLDSLISNKLDKVVEDTVQYNENVSRETLVKITEVEPNKEQPRREFDKDALNELAESIKIHGIIQPIIVKKNSGRYEIIAGERRWRAARIAGLSEVPIIIREYSEQETYEIALIENIQRENLNSIEEAVAYEKLIEEYKLKQEEVADRVGKSRSAVTNSLRLLKLDDQVKQLIIDGKLSAGHAKILVGQSAEKQKQFADKIIKDELSVRDAEKLVKNSKNKKSDSKSKVEEKDQEYINAEEEMKQVLGTKVTIKPSNDGKGKIEIEYYSIDELERILSFINGQGQ